MENENLNEKSLQNTEEEEGASLVEYALLVALIAIFCIAALKFLAGEVASTFSNIGNELGGA